jgi:hypothetical protein
MTLTEHHELPFFSTAREVDERFTAQHHKYTQIPVTGAEEMLAIRKGPISSEAAQSCHLYRVEFLQSEMVIVALLHPRWREVSR